MVPAMNERLRRISLAARCLIRDSSGLESSLRMRCSFQHFELNVRNCFRAEIRDDEAYAEPSKLKIELSFHLPVSDDLFLFLR